jgi:hypothetical protein
MIAPRDHLHAIININNEITVVQIRAKFFGFGR